jgi:signal transduction histidine kinase
MFRLRQQWPGRLSVAVHAFDLVLVSTFTIFITGPNNAFYVFFLFIMLSAACRWGFRETVATAIGMAALILLENALYESQLHLIWWHSKLPLLPNFVMPAANLLIMGLMAGFLAEALKRMLAESSAIPRITGGIQAGAELTSTLAGICSEMLRLFGAGEILIAVREADSRSIYLWRAVGCSPAGCKIVLNELGTDQAGKYFFAAPELSWCGVRANRAQAGHFVSSSLASEGERIKRERIQLPADFLGARPCNSFLADTAYTEHQLGVRLFLLNPAPEMCGVSGLLFLHSLFARVVPALDGAYFEHKTRFAVAAMERASLARELHDGVIQSLIAIEMQMAVLRGRCRKTNTTFSEQLGRIQELFRFEIQNLRMLMQRLQHLELGSRECVQALQCVALQHQSETGMPTQFESSLESANLPPRTCGEVVRILQEALVNIKKYSNAREVYIQFGERERSYLLTVRDNGAGFDFSGRLTLAELDSQGKGPKVLKERVRLIGGGLEIESVPGHGCCLDITIPRWKYEFQKG